MEVFYRSDPATPWLIVRVEEEGEYRQQCRKCRSGDQISHRVLVKSECSAWWVAEWGWSEQRRQRGGPAVIPRAWKRCGRRPDIHLRFSDELAAVVRVDMQKGFPCYDCNAAAMRGRQRLAAACASAQCRLEQSHLASSSPRAANGDGEQNCSAQGCECWQRAVTAGRRWGCAGALRESARG